MQIKKIPISLVLVLGFFVFNMPPGFADLGAYGSLGQEQAAEKNEIEKMKQELKDVHTSADEALQELNKVNISTDKPGPKEIHLFCRESSLEISPGTKINCLTYNGHLPGPTIWVQEGQMLRIVLHNQMKVPTSLHFHGMVLPQSVDGLPQEGSSWVKPGETYVYQFPAQPKGTYWYHPQIVHADQKVKGLYGALVVAPNDVPGMKIYDRDLVVFFSDIGAAQTTAANGSKTFEAVATSDETNKPTKRFYLLNGVCAPAIPPIELVAGARVRLRLINESQEEVPLHLSGHRFQVVSINGDLIQSQTDRDTITLGVSDRVEIEFVANNPGVWSLGSEKIEQATNNGKFPGGMACVIRYTEKR